MLIQIAGVRLTRQILFIHHNLNPMKRLDQLQPQRLEVQQLNKVRGGAKVSQWYSYQDENGFRWEVTVKDKKNGTKLIAKNVGSMYEQ